MAASIGARSLIGVHQEIGTGDQELDANSALTELDKGLRSPKIGLQCEAVVRFPRLFEKYPFPILINSALLKLADVFRTGNNFLRLCILKVCQQSERHLDKVLNVDEFLRRIFSVLHSNDPVARAITLRTLASVARIIAERKNVHHSIVLGLDSHNAAEVQAAILAAERFSAMSKTFAANICNKISEMIQGIVTPVDLKLSLVPILQHMHHEAHMAAKARAVCETLLTSYPAHKFVTRTLRTMSRLAAQSLVDIDHQVALLLTYVENDPRSAIKTVALQDLKMLAQKGAHLWTITYIEMLCRFVYNTPFVGLKIGGLSVLTTLSKSVAINLFPITSDSGMLDICQQYCYHDNVMLSARAVELLTDLAIHSNKKGTMNLTDDAVATIQTQIMLTATSSYSDDLLALKLGLHCAVKLCQHFPEVCTQFTNIISGCLDASEEEKLALLCESIAAIGSRNNEALQPITTTIISTLRGMIDKERSETHLQICVTLCTVLFQVAQGQKIPEQVENLIITCSKTTNPWVAYKISRQAMRYSQHPITVKILDAISKQVISEHFFHWLTALRLLSQGEEDMSRTASKHADVMQNIAEGLICYQKAAISMKISTTSSCPLHFPLSYIDLRQQITKAHCQLVRTCNTFRTCPPPAIATALAMTSGQEVSRSGQIIHQLQSCGKQYEHLITKAIELYQSSFDADPTSLQNVVLLQQACEIMRTGILALIKTNISRPAIGFSKHSRQSQVENKFALAIKHVEEYLQSMEPESCDGPLTFEHIDFMKQSAISLIQTSLGFPRFFFQSLQTTTLKLAISPQASFTNDPITVQHDSHMTLKVEGIVQDGIRPNFYRQINAVIISVSSSLVNKTSNSTDMKMTESTSNELEQTTEPLNDYFSLSFLLAFPVAGLHTVLIKAAIIDENGSTWHTGPETTLSVKCYDDSLQRAARQPAPAPSTSTSTMRRF